MNGAEQRRRLKPSRRESRHVKPEDTQGDNLAMTEPARSAEGQFVQALGRGDPDAAQRFFSKYYPSVYRYLLWLAERPETAEDLTQAGEPRFGRAADSGGGRAPGSFGPGAISTGSKAARRCESGSIQPIQRQPSPHWSWRDQGQGWIRTSPAATKSMHKV